MNLRVKEGLAIAVVVSLAILIATLAHLSTVARLGLGEAAGTGRLLAQQMFFVSRSALANATGTPADALGRDPAMQALLQAMVGYSPTVVYGSITDPEGRAIVHSDPAQVGRVLPVRDAAEKVSAQGPLPLLQMLAGAPQIVEVQIPLILGGQPFGSIRIGMSTALIRQQLAADIQRSLLLSFIAFGLALVIGLVLGDITLRPLRQISAGVDRLVRGESLGTLAVDRRDELGSLAAQLNQLGERIHENRAKLLGEKSRLEQTVRVLQDAVMFINRDARLGFVNPAAERLLGRPLPALLSMSLADLFGAGHPLVKVADAALAPGATPVSHHIRLVFAGGNSRELMVSAFPVRKFEAVEGAVVAIQDLEAVKAVYSLVDYSARLAEFGRLTSGVAHDIKNPLNAITIHLELIRRELTPEQSDARDSLQVIQREIRRLDRMVHDFLQFIRPQELKREPVDIPGLFADALAVASVEAEKAGIHIVQDIEPDAGALMGDSDALRQALGNLLQNAIQAMPDGGTITLRAALHDGQVELSVIDQGIGIPAENLDKVFRLYYTTKPGGNGIGLPHVFRIAHLHGGRVRIDSTVGAGTTVTLTVPQFRPVYDVAA